MSKKIAGEVGRGIKVDNLPLIIDLYQADKHHCSISLSTNSNHFVHYLYELYNLLTSLDL